MTYKIKGTMSNKYFIILISLITPIILVSSLVLSTPKSAEAAGYRDKVTDDYIASIGEIAREVAYENDLYASVMIAQAIKESASGTSGLSRKPNNNQFGIKGAWVDSEGHNHSVTYKTMEDDGTGNRFEIQASFRTYNTVYDSILDYAKLLTDTNDVGNFYKKTWRSNTRSYKDACAALEGNYASATDYKDGLINIIQTYNLTQYDTPNRYDVIDYIYDPDNPTANPDNGMRQLTRAEYNNLSVIINNRLNESYNIGLNNADTNATLFCELNKQAFNIDIANTFDVQQYCGDSIDVTQLRIGDLLFISSDEVPTNVGMYIGSGYYICVDEYKSHIVKRPVSNTNVIFAKRILHFADWADNSDAQKVENDKGKEAAKSLIENLFDSKPAI